MNEWNIECFPPCPGRYLVTVTLGLDSKTVVAEWSNTQPGVWLIENGWIGYGIVRAWAELPNPYSGKLPAPIGKIQ